MPDVNALSMLTSQKRGATVNALEVKTVGTRGRTRRARGGAATNQERRLYTLHRVSKKISLIGSDWPSKAPCISIARRVQLSPVVDSRRIVLFAHASYVGALGS